MNDNFRALLGILLICIPFIIREIHFFEKFISNNWIIYVLFSFLLIIISLRLLWRYICTTTKC